ncbi:PKD domain-containing protein, partial [Flavobacteriales bacterium]|nr:PKD domain-containing protein [Flavobacteriales bacterium]
MRIFNTLLIALFQLFAHSGWSQVSTTCNGSSVTIAEGTCVTFGDGTPGFVQITYDEVFLNQQNNGNYDLLYSTASDGGYIDQWSTGTFGEAVDNCTNCGVSSLSDPDLINDGYTSVCVSNGGSGVSYVTVSWTTVDANGIDQCVPCTSDSECPSGMYCNNGVCDDTPCTDDNDCPSGYVCGGAGICVSACDLTGATISLNDVIGSAEIISECGTAFNVCSYGAVGNTNCVGQTGQGNTPLYNDLDCNTNTQTGGGSAGADVGYSIENDIYYQMCPQTTGNWEIEITGYNCATSTGVPTTANGYQVSVFFGDPDGSALNTLVYGGAVGQDLIGTTTIVVNVTDITQCAFIAIDGFAGTQCEFEISVQPLDGQDCIIIDPTAGAIGVNDTICSGETASPTAYTNDVGTSIIFSWYSTETSGAVIGTGATYTTPTLTSNTSYWVEVNVDGTVSPRIEVFVIVNPLPVLAAVANPEVCANSNSVDLDALVPAETAGVGGSGQWYTGTNNTGGPVSGAQNVSDGDQFFYEYTSTVGGCVDDVIITVTVLPQIVPNFTVSGTFCENANSVNFSGSAAGVSGSETYAWSFPSGTPSTGTGTSVNGVTWAADGTYNITLTVTDGACTGEITLPVTINPMATITVIGINPTCAGGTGTISALGDPAGGGYVWDNAPNSAGPHSVTAGTYEVTYTTADGCTIVDDVTLTEPTPLTATIAPVAVTCFNACNGVAIVTPGGGSGTYAYSWDNTGASSTAITDADLCGGTTYTVTVADDADATCTIDADVTVAQPAALTLSITGTPITCNGDADGTATVTAGGGTATYTYSWAPAPGGGQGTATATGLDAVAYTVTVSDAGTCVETISYTPAEPAAVVASIAIQADVDCNGAATGSGTIAGTGGTAPYQFDIGGAQQADGGFTGLTAATYTATV